jgi:hypothetical protein
MKKYKYTINPQISKIESNKEYIPYFSFGDHLKEYSKSLPSDIEISINIVKDFAQPSGLSQKFHFCYGSDMKDEIYYERQLALGIKGKLHIKNFLNNTEITTNNAYYKFVRVKVDNLYPPGVHLADILSINLLARGYLPVHCAAISSQNEGMLLAAPPDTGKSLTTILALKHGFHYLSEDISIVDQEYVYSNPYTSTFVHYNENENPKSFKSFFFKGIPFLYYYVNTPKTSISNIIGNFKTDEKAKIKKILFLDRGKKNEIEKINAEEALRRILIINRNEFSYYKNPVLFAYSYFNSSFNINKLMGIEEKIFRTIVDKTECFLLRANDPKEYINLVMKL